MVIGDVGAESAQRSNEGVLADPKMLRYGFDIFSLWIPKIMGSNVELASRIPN